jgi:hypothetical protein
MNVDGDNGEGAATAGFGRPNRSSHRAALSSDGMVGLRRSSIKIARRKACARIFSKFACSSQGLITVMVLP